MTNQNASLVSDDPRYADMFRIEREAEMLGKAQLEPDLSAELNALREKAGVQKGNPWELLGLPLPAGANTPPREEYTVFSYGGCEIGFRENLLFSSEIYNDSEGLKSIGRTILQMVGKEHKRNRALAQPLFKRPKVLTWWKQRWIDETVDTLLTRLEGRAAADLNLEVCARLPMYTVTRAIGLSGDDALDFRFHLIRSSFGQSMATPEEVAESRGKVDQYLRDLIACRLREPGDDVITGMLEGDILQEDGTRRKLNEAELFGFCKLLIFAGGGTTWRQLGITIDALLTHYHFWEACRDDRSLLEQAVDEAVRWRATDPVFPRLVTQDTELEGVKIPKGARVHLCLAAANRDPAIWDNPDDYDIFRPKAAHMGFGFGPHRCLGMDVAKQEMISAISGMMDRWPAMKIDPDLPKPEFLGFDDRGMTAVTVKLQ